MAQLTKLLTAIGLDILWGLRPRLQSQSVRTPEAFRDQEGASSDDVVSLRALLRRFPFWARGRVLLAEVSLRNNHVATAYAEAQALRILARRGSHHEATALLLLGRCFLQRGDATSALALLNEAHALRPNDHRIQEERSAAYALLGDRSQALAILLTIPVSHLSAESKAAMQWLEGGEAPAQRKN